MEADGGIFAFLADFHGTIGVVRLNHPVTGMAGFRRGSLMVAEVGGIFSFDDALSGGSRGRPTPATRRRLGRPRQIAAPPPYLTVLEAGPPSERGRTCDH